MRHRLHTPLALAALLAACATEKPAAPIAPKDPARALAEKVFAAAGGNRLGEVAELTFRFVVLDGDKRIFEALHRWDLKGWRDRVTFTDRKGVRYDIVVDLKTKAARGTKDGAPAAGADLEELSKKAYARWVNDAYWLAMPLKLLDRGVNLTAEAPRDYEGKRYEILKLSFGQVGLTPGDNYWLFIDPETYRVVRWEMLLQGDSPPPQGVSWQDYRAVGPLWLAHDHVEAGGRVVFEDTAASATVNEADFTL
jgi:hypothetical protein